MNHKDTYCLLNKKYKHRHSMTQFSSSTSILRLHSFCSVILYNLAFCHQYFGFMVTNGGCGSRYHILALVVKSGSRVQWRAKTRPSQPGLIFYQGVETFPDTIYFSYNVSLA